MIALSVLNRFQQAGAGAQTIAVRVGPGFFIFCAMHAMQLWLAIALTGFCHAHLDRDTTTSVMQHLTDPADVVSLAHVSSTHALAARDARSRWIVSQHGCPQLALFDAVMTGKPNRLKVMLDNAGVRRSLTDADLALAFQLSLDYSPVHADASRTILRQSGVNDDGTMVPNRRVLTYFNRYLLLASVVDKGHHVILQSLVQNCPTLPKEELDFGFAFAVWKQDLDAMDLLLDGGADLNATINHPSATLWHDLSVITPLSIAIKAQNQEVLTYVLDSGADVNGQYGYALAQAISMLATQTVHDLLMAGADPSLHRPKHATPLTLAILKRNKPIARTLLRFGANVNGQNGAALFAAVHMGDVEMTRFLLDHNASLKFYQPLSRKDPLCVNGARKQTLMTVAVCCARSMAVARLLFRAGAAWDSTAVKCARTINQ